MVITPSSNYTLIDTLLRHSSLQRIMVGSVAFDLRNHDAIAFNRPNKVSDSSSLSKRSAKVMAPVLFHFLDAYVQYLISLLQRGFRFPQSRKGDNSQSHPRHTNLPYRESLKGLILHSLERRKLRSGSIKVLKWDKEIIKGDTDEELKMEADKRTQSQGFNGTLGCGGRQELVDEFSIGRVKQINEITSWRLSLETRRAFCNHQ